MTKQTNCPNCGAPIDGHKCTYCGTIFYDFSDFEIGKATYIRIKIKGNTAVFRAMLTDFGITQELGSALYYDNSPVYYSYPDSDLAMHFKLCDLVQED